MQFFKRILTSRSSLTSLNFIILILLSANPTAIFSQNEAILKNALEGKRVELKIDMPATEKGVDVRPRRQTPVNYEEYGERLKEHGKAIYIGETAIITKVRTKGKHIEFQLNGGGYGTFWDESDDVSAHYEGESEREKQLKKAIKNETDSGKKREMEDELDELRDDRERENRKSREDAEQRKIQKQQHIRDKALAAGSRFNIRYDEKLTGTQMTVESVINSLAEFVYFPPETFGDNPSAQYTDTNTGSAAPVTLQKGMLWEDISAIFGMPKSVKEAEETVSVTTSTFEDGDQMVTAKFVNGVLVKYTVSSK